uniref:EcsC family protein n=1 Tax=Pseudoclavibacter sp. RFBI5 TaxID=2080578 RepID=UPI00215877E8|nr:EcsC family protein [Pseudoclavibacter sp. RFBI5]
MSKLFELRSLDLEQVDAVRGRGANMSYPALAAASGMSAGFVISGSEFAVPATAGAAAAPSIGAIASAVTLDAAAVLALASRSVGHVALTYGYDPEEPGERLFVMSVINSGTALSAGAKTAALADISRLTQALYRGQTWAILDKSVVSQVAKRFATAFKVRVTKQSLGKFVPLAGIALGGVFNWATLEGIVDAADVAYRRRFLLEKYPQLESVDTDIHPGLAADEADDETISIVDEIRSSGGPDLGQDGLDSSSNEDLTD